MIEIVFNDSACGGLKMAQHCGKGDYDAGSVGVFVSHSDGSQPTEEEIQAARQACEEQMRREWERATPMGGSAADVYGFGYVLSVGDISENVPGEKRRQVLEWLYGIYPNLDDEQPFTEEMMRHGQAVLQEIRGRLLAGESARVWYSSQPDELCGLYWLMAQMEELELQSDQILLVALPDWDTREDGSIITRCGWGSVQLGDWHRYTALQTTATPEFRGTCASHWRRLQQENAPLRAMLNGRLVSAPETLYDTFITREIEAQEQEFHETMVVGTVLGKYELGIGDAWIAHRIERMIAAGELVPVTEPAPDSPIYHRKLRKLMR